MLSSSDLAKRTLSGIVANFKEEFREEEVPDFRKELRKITEEYSDTLSSRILNTIELNIKELGTLVIPVDAFSYHEIERKPLGWFEQARMYQNESYKQLLKENEKLEYLDQVMISFARIVDRTRSERLDDVCQIFKDYESLDKKRIPILDNIANTSLFDKEGTINIIESLLDENVQSYLKQDFDANWEFIEELLAYEPRLINEVFKGKQNGLDVTSIVNWHFNSTEQIEKLQDYLNQEKVTGYLKGLTEERKKDALKTLDRIFYYHDADELADRFLQFHQNFPEDQEVLFDRSMGKLDMLAHDFFYYSNKPEKQIKERKKLFCDLIKFFESLYERKYEADTIENVFKILGDEMYCWVNDLKLDKYNLIKKEDPQLLKQTLGLLYRIQEVKDDGSLKELNKNFKAALQEKLGYLAK